MYAGVWEKEQFEQIKYEGSPSIVGILIKMINVEERIGLKQNKREMPKLMVAVDRKKKSEKWNKIVEIMKNEEKRY